ncbi:MAG: hypothetical protein AAGK74_17805, partial [Chloroflexota bacterium]
MLAHLLQPFRLEKAGNRELLNVVYSDSGGDEPDESTSPQPLRPEAKYTKGKKHGIKWTEGPAEAKKTGIPQ